MDQFISPLTINNLRGRMLHIPGPHPTSREVVFVYGHHSSIERWQGMMELINERYTVTMPDLPGFGGMESLYKIGKPATLDNLADYLAAFMRERYKTGQKVTLVGMSLGFAVATRMLQRHPDITDNIDKLVSLFGFASASDFDVPEKRRRLFLHASKAFSLPVLHKLYRTLFLNSFVLSRTYHKTPNAREKFKNATPEEMLQNMAFEIKLWQDDDTRTYMKTGNQIMTLDNTKVKVDLPVYHIAVQNDRFLDNHNVEKHFRQIFTDFHLVANLKSANHAPTRIATKKQAEAFMPPTVLDAL
jgi:pimeloyl-ACP methyl ester carboxylesterase